MATTDSGPGLAGRRSEREAMDRLLAGVRGGESAGSGGIAA
jgi:hypothetical protein